MAFVGVLGLATCGSPATPSALGQEILLAPGQTARVADAAATIRFDEVASDSRCPADVMCITGGDAVVRVTVEVKGARTTLDLHTADLRPGQHQGLTIALLSLSPYPVSTKPISPSD